MIKAVASAPGKLVILGEYAVLANAPALVMAVNRRCRAEIRHNVNAVCHLWIVLPQRFRPQATAHGAESSTPPAFIVRA